MKRILALLLVLSALLALAACSKSPAVTEDKEQRLFTAAATGYPHQPRRHG